MDYVKAYESLNRNIECANDERVLSYWNSVKQGSMPGFHNNESDFQYETYCETVVQTVMEDEMRNHIAGRVLYGLIKAGLPYYAAV